MSFSNEGWSPAWAETEKAKAEQHVKAQRVKTILASLDSQQLDEARVALTMIAAGNRLTVARPMR